MCVGQHVSDENTGERLSKFRKLINGGGARKIVYWPRDLIPTTVSNARVLTFGYDTKIKHQLGPAISNNLVYGIAWSFLVSLEAAHRSESSRKLLFVAHSLGGIVVKETLRQSQGSEV
jgi:hypothetical protein